MADKNYTKFDNDYFCHLSSLDLNASELRVLLFLLRRSACFKRSYTRDCSVSFIMATTNLSERQVQRAIKSLLTKGYISVDYQNSGSRGNSYFIGGDKLGSMGCQVWSFRGVKNDTENIPKMSPKENTEDNSIEKKEKERASLDFFPCETELMKAMPENERQKYIELLPEYLRTKNPDDYSESEWDIYDEWRTSNGLI